MAILWGINADIAAEHRKLLKSEPNQCNILWRITWDSHLHCQCLRHCCIRIFYSSLYQIHSHHLLHLLRCNFGAIRPVPGTNIIKRLCYESADLGFGILLPLGI